MFGFWGCACGALQAARLLSTHVIIAFSNTSASTSIQFTFEAKLEALYLSKGIINLTTQRKFYCKKDQLQQKIILLTAATFRSLTLKTKPSFLKIWVTLSATGCSSRAKCAITSRNSRTFSRKSGTVPRKSHSFSKKSPTRNGPTKSRTLPRKSVTVFRKCVTVSRSCTTVRRQRPAVRRSCCTLTAPCRR